MEVKKWQDRIRSFKTGTISKHRVNVETIGVVLGWMLEHESALDVDTNVHVLLSNIELRQNEWGNM